VTIAILFARGAAAQTSLQITLQFDFVNPGAKSLALAGAFAGVADDATASYANPAGLTFLESPELSLEVRGRKQQTPFLSGGRTSGFATNIGVDTVDGPRFEESSNRSVVASYLSVVFPSASHAWVVAAYRHELARVDQSFSSTGVFSKDVAEITNRRERPQDAHRQFTIAGYGASFAYRPARGISVGGAMTAYTFDMNSEFTRYFTDGFFGPADRRAVSGHVNQLGDDVAVAPTLGVVVNRQRLRVGAVYRHGPTFDFAHEDENQVLDRGRFRVPHALAVGASYATGGRWLLSAEVNRIGYSRLKKNFVDLQAQGDPARFHIDDGTEAHASAQYAWARPSGPPIRLRGGFWFDPDHSVQFVPVAAAADASARTLNELFAAALANRGSQWHGAAGVGVTLAPRLQLNAGADFSSRQQTFSVSIIALFTGDAGP
jgi:long-subunit fatty acid transport protein